MCLLGSERVQRVESYKVKQLYVYTVHKALLSALTGLAEAWNTLLQKLQCQMGLIGSQGLADGDNEKGIVGWDAEARCLQQLALYL